VLDRRRALRGARDPDRGEGVDGPRPWRGAGRHPDRDPPGDGRASDRLMAPAGLTPEAEHLLRDLMPRVLGAVVRRVRDFAAAEDAVQEALLAALDQWPVRGMPDAPGAWLFRVAWRSLVDAQRSETARRRREETVASAAPDET